MIETKEDNVSTDEITTENWISNYWEKNIRGSLRVTWGILLSRVVDETAKGENTIKTWRLCYLLAPSPPPSPRYFRIPGVFEILKNQERIAEKSREYESPDGYGIKRISEKTCAPLTQTRVKKDDMYGDGTRRCRLNEEGAANGVGEGVGKPNVRGASVGGVMEVEKGWYETETSNGTRGMLKRGDTGHEAEGDWNFVVCEFRGLYTGRRVTAGWKIFCTKCLVGKLFRSSCCALWWIVFLNCQTTSCTVSQFEIHFSILFILICIYILE